MCIMVSTVNSDLSWKTRVTNQAKLHVDGKLSYSSALKNVESNGGILEMLIQLFKGNSSGNS